MQNVDTFKYLTTQKKETAQKILHELHGLSINEARFLLKEISRHLDFCTSVHYPLLDIHKPPQQSVCSD